MKTKEQIERVRNQKRNQVARCIQHCGPMQLDDPGLVSEMMYI
jgi:hypothetical protein